MAQDLYSRMAKDDYFRMGYFYQLSGDLQSAAQCFIRSIEFDPSAEAHTMLGRVFDEMGHLEAAIGECKKALKLKPNFTESLNDLGQYYIEKEQYDKAEPYLKKALKTKRRKGQPKSTLVEPHYNLAKIYLKKGMLISAQKELRQAVKLDESFGAAREFLSQVDRQLH